jgi:hypothetical protein
MLAFFAGPFGKWAIIGIMLVAAFGAGWIRGNDRGLQKLIDYQQKQAEEAVRITQVRTVVTERVLVKYLEKKGATERVTETIEKEVIRYETAKLDTCPLSAGAVVLHDAAAANVLPDPARTVDGTASGIETSALTKTATENYATCHKTAIRLRGLQEWVRDQAAVK